MSDNGGYHDKGILNILRPNAAKTVWTPTKGFPVPTGSKLLLGSGVNLLNFNRMVGTEMVTALNAESDAAKSNNGAVYKEQYDAVKDTWTGGPLYKFKGGADGAQPTVAPITGPGGALYGITNKGGINDGGTIYQLVE
jgi:hypothetical protein